MLEDDDSRNDGETSEVDTVGCASSDGERSVDLGSDNSVGGDDTSKRTRGQFGAPLVLVPSPLKLTWR